MEGGWGGVVGGWGGKAKGRGWGQGRAVQKANQERLKPPSKRAKGRDGGGKGKRQGAVHNTASRLQFSLAPTGHQSPCSSLSYKAECPSNLSHHAGKYKRSGVVIEGDTWAHRFVGMDVAKALMTYGGCKSQLSMSTMQSSNK